MLKSENEIQIWLITDNHWIVGYCLETQRLLINVSGISMPLSGQPTPGYLAVVYTAKDKTKTVKLVGKIIDPSNKIQKHEVPI